MLLTLKLISPMRNKSHLVVSARSLYSELFQNKYSDAQKSTLLEVVNSDIETLSRYDVSKLRLKKLALWKKNNGNINSLSDIELIEGFSERSAKKLFDSILNGSTKDTQNVTSKIKGQILHPYLSDSDRESCTTVLTVYISVNSVCWTHINKNNYEVLEWEYYGINYPEGKRLQITDILDIAWDITLKLPNADIYVMKAEATTLRAGGSDPNNPKILAVNLQKAQMIAMIVALINSRSNIDSDEENEAEKNAVNELLKQRVYFLRPTLPYRLYGTLVGNERVSTEQTVEMLLQNVRDKPSGTSHVTVPERLRNMFSSQKDLQKDMLGHCLLLSLTFMDLCIYRNRERINKLMRKDD